MLGFVWAKGRIRTSLSCLTPAHTISRKPQSISHLLTWTHISTAPAAPEMASNSRVGPGVHS